MYIHVHACSVYMCMYAHANHSRVRSLHNICMYRYVHTCWVLKEGFIHQKAHMPHSTRDSIKYPPPSPSLQMFSLSLCSFEVVLNVLHDVRGGSKVSESALPLSPNLCRDAVHDHALCPSHPATLLHLLQPLLDSLSSDRQVALLFLQIWRQLVIAGGKFK